MLYVNPIRTRMLKVKVLNHNTLVQSPGGKELQRTIKVLFNSS